MTTAMVRTPARACGTLGAILCGWIWIASVVAVEPFSDVSLVSYESESEEPLESVPLAAWANSNSPEWDAPALFPRRPTVLASYDEPQLFYPTAEYYPEPKPGDKPAGDKPKEDKPKADSKPKEKKWYEKLSIRGYTQVRINGAAEYPGSPAVAQYVPDSSVRDNQGFIIRRARIIFSGDVHEHLSVYLQPDFASSVSGVSDSIEFCQIRDFYCDIYLDCDKVHRIRPGQSKVPYGFEDLQSSSNRVPLDRAEAFNSGVRNERDLGVFYYWTPVYAQQLYKYVLDNNLKGSGNYGVFGCGVYNGQGGSLGEVNENLHFVARFNVPYQFDDGQIIEVGIQGYTGRYGVLGSNIFPNGVGPASTPLGTTNRGTISQEDNRAGVSFVYYPQPLGFQTEWTWGRGPKLNAAQTAILTDDLQGGYAMILYKYETDCHGTLFPFVRYQYFEGGYKSERNAPATYISEWETGVEWQFHKNLELTTNLVFTDRTNTTATTVAGNAPYQQFEGSIFRVQLQFNY